MSQQDTLDKVLKLADQTGVVVTPIPARVVKNGSGDCGKQNLGHYTARCDASYQMQHFLRDVRQLAWGALELRACGIAFHGFEMPDGLRVKLSYLDQEKMGRHPTEALLSIVPLDIPWTNDTVQEILHALADHPDVEVGNSKVHFAYHKIRALMDQESEATGLLRRYVEHVEEVEGTNFLKLHEGKLSAEDRDLIRRITGKQ